MALLYGAPQMTSEFKVLNDFVGCGNPSGKYWFIGLEEAGEWGSNTIRQDIERYRERILPVDPGAIKSEAQKKGKGYTKIYDIMSKIVLAIDARETNYLQYRDNELLLASGETFQENLFPLGK